MSENYSNEHKQGDAHKKRNEELTNSDNPWNSRRWDEIKTVEMLENKISLLDQKNNLLEEELKKEKLEKLNISKTLYEEYNYMEELLKELKALEKKYHALVNSKLGKITLKYWNYRNRGRG